MHRWGGYMKRKVEIFLLFLFSVTLIAGSTQAWFSSAAESSQELLMTTVELNLIQDDLEDLRVENIGKGSVYIRVRMLPVWSDNDLSISNVKVEANEEDWIGMSDGYYYFRYYLVPGQITSSLIQKIELMSVDSEYEGSYLSIKVTAEGVLATNEAWKQAWGIEELPFEPEQPYIQ